MTGQGRFYWALIVVAACGLGISAIAQTPVRESPTPENRVDARRSDDFQRKLMLARQLMGQQKFDAAAAMLEVIQDQAQGDPVADNMIANLLLNCYQQLKQYMKAEAVARRLAELYPTSLGYQLTFAELLAQQGKVDEATAGYKKAVALIQPFDENQFGQLIGSTLSSGLDDLSLQLIDSIRAERHDSLLFAIPKGAILEKQQKYTEAVREYYPVLLQDTTAAAVNAEKRLLSLLDFVNSSEPTERALLALTGQTVNERVLNLLATHYIRAEEFDKAYAFAIRQDSLQRTDGRALMQYMAQCQERKLWPQVVRMGEYFFSRYRGGLVFQQTMFIFGQALAEAGRSDSAIVVYNRIVSEGATVRDKAEALYRIGEIHMNSRHDYLSALKCFDSVTANYRQGTGYFQALRMVPFCYLRLGDLETAEAKFSELPTMRLPEDILEEVYYYLGLIAFYRHDFDTAETDLRKLMVDFPRGFYINDALELVKLKTEAGSATELLGHYADALFYSEKMMPDSAKAQLIDIVEADNKALADVALYRLAGMELATQDSSRALAFIDRLAGEFPESYYLPYGLNMKADILVRRGESVEEAKTIYRLLLEKYPNYPFTSEVRKRLRELETGSRIG